MSQKISRPATLMVICTAHFLMPFMMSAVSIALPMIGREFHASAKQLALVETSYVLSASIFLLAMGRLGDIYGRRRIFEYGVIFFTIMGGLLSQSWSIESMVMLRFLQGLGGSMVMATTFAIVVSVFPPDERGRALGISVASVYAGIACGPILGGILITLLGWRSIFYLAVPLGLIIFCISITKLRGEWAESQGEPFDWLGSLVYAVSITILIIGSSSLDRGWWGGYLVVGGVVGLFLFWVFESRANFPILDVSLLRNNRVFAFSSLAALLNYAATFGVTFFLSLYLQFVRGFTPWDAGALLVTQPLVQAVFSPVCGLLADRFSASKVATLGMALCVIGLGIATGISADSSELVLILTLVTLGLGFALFSSPNISVIMGSIPKRHLGVASGLNSTMRTLGMMLSMTIITVVFSIFMDGQEVSFHTQEQFLASMKITLLSFATLCLFGIFFSWSRIR